MNDNEKPMQPILSLVEGSEIEGDIDGSAIGLDGIFRPLYIQQDCDVLNLSIADARRLLSFLNKAIPYLESNTWEH